MDKNKDGSNNTYCKIFIIIVGGARSLNVP
jgi:hypothetical protein